MDFEPSARSEQWRGKLLSFFDCEVLPRHRAWLEHTAKREPVPFMGELQQKARAAGLWNLGLPELADDEPGTRLSNLEYAPLGRNHGATVLGLRSLQLPGARRSQHDRAAELRHAGAEAALAAPAARSRAPVRHSG